MASKNASTLAVFFALNIFCFTFTSATDCCTPTPVVPNPVVPTPVVPNPAVPSPVVPSPSVPVPNPVPVIPPSTPVCYEHCPIDTIKLGVCADVLENVLSIQIGQPSSHPCCSLIHGLIDLDAAFCFCTALKANILGMNIDIPISLSVLLNFCRRKVPYGFECA